MLLPFACHAIEIAFNRFAKRLSANNKSVLRMIHKPIHMNHDHRLKRATVKKSQNNSNFSALNLNNYD